MKTVGMIKAGEKELKQKANILLYFNDRNKIEKVFLKLIEDLIPRNKINIYGNVESLLARLHKPRPDESILVLFISDNEDLKRILTFKPELDDFRIILILPDRNNIMVTMGHSLRPRFLSYYDSDLNEVKEVLKKMVSA